MCEPISLFGATAAASSTGVATAGLLGAGGAFTWGASLGTLATGLSAFSAISGAQTQKANMKYQSQMANYQAQIDENNAILKEQAAEYDADMLDDKKKRMLGKMQTMSAKSGVLINQDSALDAQIDVGSEFAADRLAILYRGQLGAEADRANAAGQRFSSRVSSGNAKRAGTAGYLNAALSLGEGAYKKGLIS